MRVGLRLASRYMSDFSKKSDIFMKLMPNTTHVPLPQYIEYPLDEMQQRAQEFYAEMRRRRSVRQFSNRAVPRDIIENCIRAAGTAPNGANMQPWHFVAVSDTQVKQRIRVAAEEEERAFYAGRAPQEWLNALAPLGTDASKPFLEIAPWLIVIFAQSHGMRPDGSPIKHYYAQESVGIATGLLISAVQHAGLVSLTHTPSPMAFLNDILDCPSNERPFLVLVVGYPADYVTVPTITKKSLDELATFL